MDNRIAEYVSISRLDLETLLIAARAEYESEVLSAQDKDDESLADGLRASIQAAEEILAAPVRTGWTVAEILAREG